MPRRSCATSTRRRRSSGAVLGDHEGRGRAAFAELVTVDECLAQAGESRQDIDLVWGAVLTRYLTMAKYSGFGNVKSAGRVQTPTLALIVEREREREAFVPEIYWTVKGGFATRGRAASARVLGRSRDRPLQVRGRGAARHGRDRRQDVGKVTAAEKKRRKVAPPTPFNTTALQAAAAAEGITPARTMRIAESLYMDGLISYPRVDNTVYPDSLDLPASSSARRAARVPRAQANKLLHGGALHPTRGATRRPTTRRSTRPAAADPDKMRPEQWKLYNLVARRFLATLSDAAVVEGTKVTIDVGGEPFVAKGDVLVVPGFRADLPVRPEEGRAAPRSPRTTPSTSSAPRSPRSRPSRPRATRQGRLIQEMEKRGLGTKATRHAIIERLLEVRYAVNEPLEPTCLGRAVIDALSAFAPRITTPDMTRSSKPRWTHRQRPQPAREVVAHSRELLARVMDELIPNATDVGEALKEAGADDAKVGVCPKSGHDLLVKSSPKTRGQFVGCSGWPECDVTYPLPQGKIEPLDEPCAVCGTPRVKVIQFRSKPRVVCLDPACPTNKFDRDRHRRVQGVRR